MPERNPFEETMRAERAGMNVPQRTVRPTMRDVAGPIRETQGGRGQDVFDPRRLGLGEGPYTYGKDPFDTRRLGLGGGPLTYGKDPFDPRRLGMDSGDTLGALLGGLDREQEEGVGEYAGGPGMQNVRVEGNLWKQAHANVAKQFGVSAGEVSGKASQGAIQREFTRLKEMFYSKKYGTGIMKGIGKGSPLGMMMELMPLDPALESIGEVLDPEAPGWV